MKNYFIYSFLIIFMINFNPAFGMEQICVATTCNRYTQTQLVHHIWNLVENPTPLGIQLKHVLSSMFRSLKRSDHKLTTIFAQTLWSVNIYLDFQPNNLSISCVFERLLYMTILDDEFNTKEYNQAITNFGALMRQVNNFTVRSSLARFSCPTTNPPLILPRPRECLNGSIVKLFLEKYGSILPSNIVSLIVNLSKSQNVKDRTVALTLCVVSIEPLNGLYQCFLEAPEFLKIIQLKACDVPILPCCCKLREEDFRSRYAAASPIRWRLVDGLLKK